ncbi:peptidylprolyl isomerase [Aquincola sp. MAHUQ-54]|uniref:Peptidylprolyl isomerase n=1 Tax=Aquincola agrisoli TaxID=3119538 RepID=A0AAW9QDV6_9BURK
MSSSRTNAASAGRKAARGGSTPPVRWWREPLLHFLLLGGLLFAVDHVIVGRAEDPRTIVLAKDVDDEAKELFKASRGREPNADELNALRRTWLDNEVLYREGLAMQVDRGDDAIRERVIFKALSILETDIKQPPFDDALLRGWFEQHREKYDEPARYDFQEAVLSGDMTEAAATGFAHTLNTGAPGDSGAGLRVFKGRPHANIVQSYGEDFATALESTPPGEWRAIAGRDGWRVMQLTSTTPARPADFDTLRGVVLQDWTDAVMAQQRTDAVRKLAERYKIQIEAEQP